MLFARAVVLVGLVVSLEEADEWSTEACARCVVAGGGWRRGPDAGPRCGGAAAADACADLGCCAVLRCASAPGVDGIRDGVLWSVAADGATKWRAPPSEAEAALAASLRRELRATRGVRFASASGGAAQWWDCLEDAVDVLAGACDARLFRAWPLLHGVLEATDQGAAIDDLNAMATADADVLRYLDLATERGGGNEPGAPIVFSIAGEDTGSGAKVEDRNVSAAGVSLALLAQRFEAELGGGGAGMARLDEAALILDFGSGFGLLGKLLFQNTRFSGYYVLWDRPALSALQAYHLSAAGLKVARTAQELTETDSRVLCTSVVGEVFEAIRRLSQAKTLRGDGARVFVAAGPALAEAAPDRRNEVEAVLLSFRFTHFLVEAPEPRQILGVPHGRTSSRQILGAADGYFDVPHGALAARLSHLVDLTAHPLRGRDRGLVVGRPRGPTEAAESPSPRPAVIRRVTVEVDIDDESHSLTVREDESIRDAVRGFVRLHGIEADAEATAKLHRAVHLSFADDIEFDPQGPR